MAEWVGLLAAGDGRWSSASLRTAAFASSKSLRDLSNPRKVSSKSRSYKKSRD